MESAPLAGPLAAGGVIRFTEEESLFVSQHGSPAVKLNRNVMLVACLSVSWNSFRLGNWRTVMWLRG